MLSEKFDTFPEQHEEEFSKIRKPEYKWGKTTGVPKKVLTPLFKTMTTWPEKFNIHPIIKKIYNAKIQAYEKNEPLDWPTLESLCWATLLEEGYGVRVSGEDVERGPFSQRHSTLSDQEEDK